MKTIGKIYFGAFAIAVFFGFWAWFIGTGTFPVPDPIEAARDPKLESHYSAYCGMTQMMCTVASLAGLGIAALMRICITSFRRMYFASSLITISELIIAFLTLFCNGKMIVNLRCDALHITMLIAGILCLLASGVRWYLLMRCYPALPFDMPYGNNYRGLPEGDEVEDD